MVKGGICIVKGSGVGEGGGHAWQSECVCGKGACMAGGACRVGEGAAWQEKWQLQQVVCILLECILVDQADSNRTI